MRKMRKFVKSLKLTNDNSFGGGGYPKRLLTAALMGCVAAVGAQSAQAAPVETNRIIVTEADTVISGQTYEDRQSSSYGPDWSIWGTAGGVIQNSGQNLTIKDTTFNNNAARINADNAQPWQAAMGGAVYNAESATIKEINNVTFSGNSAFAGANTAQGLSGRGGALYNAGSISSIKDSSFTNNTANQGGAIYNQSSGHIGTIDNVTFNGNEAQDGYNLTGGIFNEGTIDAIQNSSFVNNTGNNSNSGASAIFNTGTISLIKDTSIEGTGRLIVNDGGTISEIDGLTVNGQTISGILFNMSGTVGDIKNSNIISNNVGDSDLISFGVPWGGTPGSMGNIINSKFYDNSANSLFKLYEHSCGDIIGSEFKNNKGHYLFSIADGNMGNIINSVFDNNTATIIQYQNNYNYDSVNEPVGVGNIENSKFYNNSGGIIVSNNASVGNIINSEFKNNSNSNGNGAVINVINSSYSPEIIPNVGKIEKSLFEGNKVNNEGGVIHVAGHGVNIKEITETIFRNNSASEGGALSILNGASTSDISDTIFEGNTANAGGAISLVNSASYIGNLTNVHFKNNNATNNGGSIDVILGTVGKLSNVTFENSTAGQTGGAIYNNGTIEGIYNTTFKDNQSGDGGAIWSGSSIGTLQDLIFTGNKAIGNDNNSVNGRGGAIYFLDKLTLQGKNLFKDNYAKEGGGAIWADQGIAELNDTCFDGNTSGQLGGAILVWNKSIDGIKNSKFVNNKTGYTLPTDPVVAAAYGSGGAIWVNEKLGDIENSYFEGNETVTKYNDQYEEFGHGGAIYAPHDIGKIKNTTFKNNIAGNSGGAIWTSGSIDMVENSLFEGNKANTSGGAIMYYGYDFDNAVNYKASIKNSSFLNNTAEKGRGGAIYATGDLDITADKGNVIFNGNKDSKGANDIYIDTTTGTNVNVVAKNNGNVEFHGGIDSSHEYNLNVNGDSSSRVLVDGNIKNANMTIDSTNVYSATPAFLTSTTNLAVNSGTLNFPRLDNSVYNFNKLSNSGTINVGVVDVDVEKETMGRITASNYGDMSKGVVNVADLNLLTNPVKNETKVLFADKAFVNTVQYHGRDIVYTPIYKYDVSYLPGSGEFMFVRSNGGSEKNAFNPAVLASPSNVQAGSQATMNETFKYVFEHADAFTQFPATERMAKINANKYALSTDYNSNMGSLDTNLNNKGAWVRPYATFETMDLRHGPKVDAVTYGTLVGFDSNFHEMKNGWTNVFTGYLGYNGAQLNYSGADTSMNGGLLGFTETFYKGNFWTALTVSAGASVGETRTMYGKEDFTSLLAGIGSKTGYNFEFKEGKVILQPIMFMSYTFINTFDFTNASGVRIKNDPMHSIQLNPSIRIIGNLNHGWQPYASVGMVWNLLNESQSTANGIRLPEMSMKPYVEYGVGIQKHWSDKFTAFGQAMIRNGGRNGIALTAGFRWALGQEGKPVKHNEKVSLPQTKISLRGLSSAKVPAENLIQTPRKVVSSLNGEKIVNAGERKIIKQLSDAQRISYGKNQNTTRTTCKGSIKSL